MLRECYVFQDKLSYNVYKEFQLILCPSVLSVDIFLTTIILLIRSVHRSFNILLQNNISAASTFFLSLGKLVNTHCHMRGCILHSNLAIPLFLKKCFRFPARYVIFIIRLSLVLCVFGYWRRIIYLLLKFFQDN